MTTNEFIREVKSIGYHIAFDDEKLCEGFLYITKNQFSLNIIARVSVDKIGLVDTCFENFITLNEETKQYLLNLLMKYTETPLEERKGEEDMEDKHFNTFSESIKEHLEGIAPWQDEETKIKILNEIISETKFYENTLKGEKGMNDVVKFCRELYGEAWLQDDDLIIILDETLPVYINTDENLDFHYNIYKQIQDMIKDKEFLLGQVNLYIQQHCLSSVEEMKNLLNVIEMYGEDKND